MKKLGGNAVNMLNHMWLTAEYLSICQRITAFLIETFVNHQCPSEEMIEKSDQTSVTIFVSVTFALDAAFIPSVNGFQATKEIIEAYSTWI